MPSSAAPVTESERIGSIDVLRGFAVLGILVMNIQLFAMPFSAYFNPTAYGDLSGANYWVWFFSHLLADQKFMTLFSLLFGAGVVLMSSRIEAQGHRPGPIYYRRTFWLLVFGLLHAYLIWYGDILVLYAVCGSVVFLMRRQPARRLLMIGMLVIAVGSGISLFFGWSMRFWPPDGVHLLSRREPDLHDDFLRPRTRLFRVGGSRRTDPDHIRGLYIPVDLFHVVATAFSIRPVRVGLAFTDLRETGTLETARAVARLKLTGFPRPGFEGSRWVVDTWLSRARGPLSDSAQRESHNRSLESAGLRGIGLISADSSLSGWHGSCANRTKGATRS